MKRPLPLSMILMLTPVMSSICFLAHAVDIPYDIKVNIARKLETPDLQSYGRVSRDCHTAMQVALTDHKTSLKASQITADNVVNLRIIGALTLKVDTTDDEHLALIGQLTNLKVLNSQNSGFTDAWLHSLQNLKSITVLSINDTKITNAGLKALPYFPNLRKLDLSFLAITDAGLPPLQALTNLQSLRMVETSITDAGLETLKSLTSLQQITLDDTNVTEAGMKDLKDHLKKAQIEKCG